MMYRRMTSSWALAAAFAAAGLVAVAAQAPAGGQGAAAGAPAGAQAPAAQGGRGGGRGGGGRGGGRGMTPSAARAVPAEATAAKSKDPKWTYPRKPWGDPDIEGEFSSDDMRGIPTNRQGNRGGGPAAPVANESESLTPEEFLQRASGDEAG